MFLCRRSFFSASAKSPIMALVSSCGECDTPIRKSFSRAAYENGLVLIRCDGCGVRHLIADNIGWMSDQMSRERTKGEPVNLSTQYGDRLKTGTLSPALTEQGELTLELDDLRDVVEGLSEEELRQLYLKVSQRKH